MSQEPVIEVGIAEEAAVLQMPVSQTPKTE